MMVLSMATALLIRAPCRWLSRHPAFMPYKPRADVSAATHQPDCATRGAADTRTSQAIGQMERTAPVCCGSKQRRIRDRKGEWAKSLQRAYDNGMVVGIEADKQQIRVLKLRVGLLKRCVRVLRKRYGDSIDSNSRLMHQIAYEREGARDVERQLADWLHYHMGPGE